MSEPNNARWANIYQAMTGITAPGHHEAPVGANEQSVTAGHEPDRFDAKGIIMVPILVIVVTTLAYVLVSFVFSYINPGKPVTDPTMSPLAIEQESKSFDERAARISNVDPKVPVRQPRLEGIVVVDQNRPGVDKPDPVNYRSFPPSTKNNTYYLKPQDLYPAKFADPLTGEKLLDEWKVISADKHVARIPVDEAMALILKNGSLKAKPAPAAAPKPTQANGGQAK